MFENFEKLKKNMKIIKKIIKFKFILNLLTELN